MDQRRGGSVGLDTRTMVQAIACTIAVCFAGTSAAGAVELASAS